MMKFVTQHVQGMEEDQSWLADSWIHKDRDHVKGAEEKGVGIYHTVGTAAFPVVPFLERE